MGIPHLYFWLLIKYPSIVAETNDNATRFDNLYLDMNGILLSSMHPKGKLAPKTEDEVMMAALEETDRIIDIVRPRRLMFLAIDGVVPLAKIINQRSRRYLSAKEYETMPESDAHMRPRCNGLPRKNPKSHVSSATLMDRFSTCLNYYIHQILNKRLRNCKVILSDAHVPGESEHKIIDFIRKQRVHDQYDPNTKHCVFGADSDLIMLGLATHEVNFTIMREKIKKRKSETNKPACLAPPKYNFIHLCNLRRYLRRDMALPNLPFTYDFERVVDDWVFMCLFVGNDFLPNLPSLDIMKDFLDRLVCLYKKCIYKAGGFLTMDGTVDLSKVQFLMNELGEEEKEIFEKRMENSSTDKRDSSTNKSTRDSSLDQISDILLTSDDRSSDDGQVDAIDEVRLWERGYKERYYELKFDVTSEDVQFRSEVAENYIRGLCWIMKYYYQGCPSWEWYYPYHYAPFASDFDKIANLKISFPRFTKPLKPLEQLMAVLPRKSCAHVPAAWRHLMTSPDSPIIDFYPTDVKIDLNGKKYLTEGTVLLPFVDLNRLLATLAPLYEFLTPEEVEKNKYGYNRLYLGPLNSSYNYVCSLYNNENVTRGTEKLISFDGMQGSIYLSKENTGIGSTLKSPINALSPLENNKVIFVKYLSNFYGPKFVFKSIKLHGATEMLYKNKMWLNLNSQHSKSKNELSTQRIVINKYKIINKTPRKKQT